MDYDKQLEKIRKAKKSPYKLDMSIIIILLLGITSSIFIPIIAPLFGVFVFVLFYQRLLKVARMPCPQCGKPFGSNSYFVLGVDFRSCQNCDLSLYPPSKRSDGTEWLE